MGFKPFRPRLYPQPMPLVSRRVEALTSNTPQPSQKCSSSEFRNAETQNSELRNAETQNSELTNVEAQPLRTPNAGSAWGGAELSNSELRNAETQNSELRTQECRNSELRTQKCRNSELRTQKCTNSATQNSQMPELSNSELRKAGGGGTQQLRRHTNARNAPKNESPVSGDTFSVSSNTFSSSLHF